MEELSNAANNVSQQQSVSSDVSPFMNNLTAVGPISSQVVDEDFQSDPKWEFTPLEKASLDCIEMEPVPFDPPGNEQQADQDFESISQDQDKSELAKGSDDCTQIESQTTRHNPEVNKETLEHQSCVEAAQDRNDDLITQSPAIVNQKPEPSMDTLDITKDELDAGVIIAEEIIEISQIGDSHSQNVSMPVVSQPDTISTDITDRLNQASESGRFLSLPEAAANKIENSSVNITVINGESNYLSQNSADAQMEKVIDNVVELSSGQPFDRSLDCPEDKAKLIETIHREITSDRSSMEIMADIALQQIPLVTETDSTLDKPTSDVCLRSQTVHEPPEKGPARSQIEEEAERTTKMEKALDTSGEPDLEKTNVTKSSPKKSSTKETPQPKKSKRIQKRLSKSITHESEALAEVGTECESIVELDIDQRKLDAEKVTGSRKSIDLELPIKFDRSPKAELPSEGEQTIDREERSEPEKLDEAMKPTRSMRVRAPKKPFDESPPKVDQPKKQAKRSRLSIDNESNKTFETATNIPMIKLPTQRSRATISMSNPATRQAPPSQKRKRSPSPEIEANSSFTEKKYKCSACNFTTDRLNNVVYHYNKSYCPGKCQMVEFMKADIIKQQQTPKGSKSKRQAR